MRDSIDVLKSMLRTLEKSLQNNEATFALLKEPYEAWDSGKDESPNIYVIRLAVDHLNSAKKDREEIAALRDAIRALS
jgi:hypothetical protein